MKNMSHENKCGLKNSDEIPADLMNLCSPYFVTTWYFCCFWPKRTSRKPVSEAPTPFECFIISQRLHHTSTKRLVWLSLILFGNSLRSNRDLQRNRGFSVLPQHAGVVVTESRVLHSELVSPLFLLCYCLPVGNRGSLKTLPPLSKMSLMSLSAKWTWTWTPVSKISRVSTVVHFMFVWGGFFFKQQNWHVVIKSDEQWLL